MGFLGGTQGVPDGADTGFQDLGGDREQVTAAFLSWGDPLTDPANQLGELHFDVVYSEMHERSAEVTDHSVEQGISVSDHVRPLPDRVSLDVFVSNTPVRSRDAQLLPLTLDIPKTGQWGGFLAGGTSQILSDLASAVGLTKSYPTQLTAMVQQFAGDTDYVNNANNILTALRDQAMLLTVTTPHQLYTNMIIETFTMNRDRSTGTSANFSIELRQIRVVSSSIVDAPLPSIKQATPMVSEGKKDPEPVDAPKESVAHDLRRLLQPGGLLNPGGG